MLSAVSCFDISSVSKKVHFLRSQSLSTKLLSIPLMENSVPSRCDSRRNTAACGVSADLSVSQMHKAQGQVIVKVKYWKELAEQMFKFEGQSPVGRAGKQG